jgi:hypothetical protein
MKITTPVLNAIRRNFSPEDAKEVISTFENVPDFSATWEYERIQFAILVQAQGSLALFKEAFALAEDDWRDILVAARLSRLNWPDKVLKAGLADKDWYDQAVEQIRKNS